jgi:hypothetical protein
MALPTEYDDLFLDIRAKMAEHFPNFMFVVMDDGGDIFFDYTNVPIGKMLARELIEAVTETEPVEVEWDDDDDDDLYAQ